MSFWAYANNITLAAAQEAARAASAQGSSLEHGLSVGQLLIDGGLGPSGQLVALDGDEDAVSVSVRVRGAWPLGLGSAAFATLPLDHEVRVHKQVWQP